MLIFADNTFWDNFYANLPAFLAAVFLFIQNLRNHKQNSSNIGHVQELVNGQKTALLEEVKDLKAQIVTIKAAVTPPAPPVQP